jgi:hypothetical protein
MVALLLVFTVEIGQAHRGTVRVQRIWSHKRDEWSRATTMVRTITDQ